MRSHIVSIYDENEKETEVADVSIHEKQIQKETNLYNDVAVADSDVQNNKNRIPFFAKFKNYIFNSINNFRNSKKQSVSDMPAPLRMKLLLSFFFSIAIFVFGLIFSVYFKALDSFFYVLVFDMFAICFSCYFYYIFSRQKYIRWIGVPLEKKINKNVTKKYDQYVVVVCCQDETQRELKMTKNDYCKLAIGATYAFYFGINHNDINNIDYNSIYGYEEIKVND